MNHNHEKNSDCPGQINTAIEGHTGDIAGKTSRGIIWSFLGQGVNKVVTLLTLMILARLLTKEDFGLVAAAMILITFLSVYKNMGLGNALIQYQGDTVKAADSVFTMNLIMGILLSTSVYFFAPLISLYFENPEMTPLVRCLGISFIINAIGAVHFVLLKKDLNYRKKILPDIGGALTKGAVSIVMAFMGYGVWSIVIGQLVGAGVSVIIVWLVLPWRPRLRIDSSISSSLLRFGGSIMGIDTLSVLTENLSFIITGKICGIALLGVFTLSYRLPEALLIGNLWVLSGVFFPMFAMVQHDPEKLRKGFLASIRLVSLLATPVSLGLYLSAEPLILVFYGSQWHEAIPVLKILAIYALVHSIGFHAGDIYKAIGKPNILLALSIAAFMLDLTALLIGAQYGLTGIASGLLIAITITNTLSIIIAKRLIRVSLGQIFQECKSALISGLVFALTALLANALTAHYSPLIRLASIAIPATLIYMYLLWIMEKSNIVFVLKKIGLNKKNGTTDEVL